MDKQANSVRMPPDPRPIVSCPRVRRGLQGAASRRRRGVHVRFKTTSRSSRGRTRADRARERDRRTDRRNLEFARAAVRLLRDTDGNTVQRMVPPTAPPPLTTTRTGWHWSSSSSRPGREENNEVAAILQELRRASAENLEAPDNGRPGGVGTLAGLVR